MDESKKPAQRRNNDLAMIHIAKKELGLDEEAYRDVLMAIGGKSSAKELDYTARQKVLIKFRSMGWTPGKPGEKKPGKPVEPGSQASKIWALWFELKAKGKIQSASVQALSAFCKRQTGVERIEWLTAAQANNVIEALKQWLARA